MAKYLDPKADLTFKKVFGEHKELLISFLNALLPLPEGKDIVSLEYLSSELVPVNPDISVPRATGEIEGGKDTVVDVRCKDKNGRQFVVEMQMYWTNAFKKRALLNTCKAYSLPADRGEKYTELKPVYTLSLVNDIAFPELPDDFYHCYVMTHNKYREYTIDRYWDAVSREKTAMAEKYELGEARGIEIGEARATERERQKAYEEKQATAKTLKAMGKLSLAEIAAATGIQEADIETL